jgi:hypothetical protein
LPITFFKIDTIHGARGYTQRVPAALACVTKYAYFAFQLFFCDYIDIRDNTQTKILKKPHFHSFLVKNRYKSTFDQQKVKIWIDNILHFCVFLHHTTLIYRLKKYQKYFFPVKWSKNDFFHYFS